MPSPARPSVAVATCAARPDGHADDHLLVDELRGRGFDVRYAVWDHAAVDWTAFDVVVIRSTWDYHKRRDEFVKWAHGVRNLVNPAAVIEWNTDKRYLADLEQRGIAIVPTLWVDAEGAAIPFANPVIKPAVSAGSRNTLRFSASEHEAATRHLKVILDEDQVAMVQPYIDAVDSHGETALIYFDGVFSHAIRKGAILGAAGPHEMADDGLYAEEEIAVRTPTKAEREFSDRVMQSLPWPAADLAYARVDVVLDDSGAPMVLELELAEPSLFLMYCSEAASRLADAIQRRISA